jgi:hypothetical protein
MGPKYRPGGLLIGVVDAEFIDGAQRRKSIQVNIPHWGVLPHLAQDFRLIQGNVPDFDCRETPIDRIRAVRPPIPKDQLFSQHSIIAGIDQYELPIQIGQKLCIPSAMVGLCQVVPSPHL